MTMQAAQMPGTASGLRPILAVDDDPVALMMIEGLVARLGYPVLSADSGEAALRLLQGRDDVGAILLDREMPGMGGIDTVRRLKADPGRAGIPVIMVTGANEPEQMREGIEAGVYYYLEKPADARLLSSVLTAALRQAEDRRRLQNGQDTTLAFDLTTAARFEFRSMAQASALAGFAANYFPDPDRVVQGLAALCCNAVEHGICGVGFETKGRLLVEGTLEAEIAARLADRPDARASLTVSRRSDGIFAVIEDPGPGFAWRDFVQFDVARSQATHGRGIAMARATAFDDLRFSEEGNKVVARIKGSDDFDW